ncbi:Cloroperoxidase [Mycena capillaripes]|nr:Cloroperoxidase [Mycena capillaripes]
MQLPEIVLYLAALATSHIHTTIATDTHQWIAPTSTDARSPCPGLNTLANHGYLPRSGRNISVPMILDAALEGFNVDPDGLIVAAKFGLLSGNAPTTLDLEALALHSLIEHDASLSRGDFALGDNLHFNETIFATLANANPRDDKYNATSAGQVMRDRLDISLTTNPSLTNTPKEFALRTIESALYLSVMGNPLTGIAPKEFVQVFFREERMPIEEGWTRPTTSITRASLNALGAVIMANANWTATQECEALVLGPDTTI